MRPHSQVLRTSGPITGSTGGALGTGRGAGGASGSGNLRLNFDTAEPPGRYFPAGALVSMQVKLDSGDVYSGSARIGKHKVTWDTGGAPVEVAIPFTTHGVWTTPTT